jgi:hypothetical protein
MITDPTEHDLNYAITGNMEHLLVVMKAVRRFKNGLFARQGDGKSHTSKSPPILATLFGGPGSRLTAPPATMQKSKSVDGDIHGAGMEKEMVISGLHRDMKRGSHGKISAASKSPVSSPQSPGTPVTLIPSRHDTKVLDDDDSVVIGQGGIQDAKPDSADAGTPTQQALDAPNTPEEVGKGHARDPLADKLFLNVGPGTTDFSKPHDIETGATGINDFPSVDRPDPQGANDESDAQFVISESPSGLEEHECNIYETAYQDEVRRILAERQREEAASSSPTTRPVVMHLTKRVEHLAELRNHPNIVGGGEIAKGFMKDAADAAGGFASVVRQAAERTHALAMEKAAERNNATSNPGIADGRQNPEVARKRSSLFNAVKATTTGMWQSKKPTPPAESSSSTPTPDNNNNTRHSIDTTASTSSSRRFRHSTATDLATAAAAMPKKALASLWQPSAAKRHHLETPHPPSSSSSSNRATPANTATPSKVYDTVAERVYHRASSSADKFGAAMVDAAAKMDSLAAARAERNGGK